MLPWHTHALCILNSFLRSKTCGIQSSFPHAWELLHFIAPSFITSQVYICSARCPLKNSCTSRLFRLVLPVLRSYGIIFSTFCLFTPSQFFPLNTCLLLLRFILFISLKKILAAPFVHSNGMEFHFIGKKILAAPFVHSNGMEFPFIE
ncbi:hypothetical protein DUNSADRAFT_8419 [Dunaliella salina]|uniref:Encoded protein n=1 Tax=Dunaliella salina TaxID=3046 RepID=A0ABQ7GJK1_DUNSA|nr:hypothetical protein DUNSADRAFT_8419 [Dunaliella salina]|eukprot:KAF5834778.1 hypothetical protein DUNSADRAFT_8419 [Dunaliella salina]